jgi:hypothetical protein
MDGYVHVNEYADVLYVEAMRQGEIAYQNGPPYLRVPKLDGAEGIGRTVREVLDASTMPTPYSPPPFLEWSGARSWSMFTRRSKLVTIGLEGDRIVLYPHATDRKANSFPMMDQKIEVSAAAWGRDLGEAVLAALERSTTAPTR